LKLVPWLVVLSTLMSPPVCLTMPKHGGESEACALSFLLGREEGLKDSLYGLRVHAKACVVDLEQDVLAWVDVEVRGALEVELDVGSSRIAAFLPWAWRRVR